MSNTIPCYLSEDEINDIFGDVLDELSGIEGLQAEVCGRWLWVRNFKSENARALRGLGFRFSKNKKMWYKKDNDQPYRRDWVYPAYSMDKVREVHGRVLLHNRPTAKKTFESGERFANTEAIPTIF